MINPNFFPAIAPAVVQDIKNDNDPDDADALKAWQGIVGSGVHPVPVPVPSPAVVSQDSNASTPSVIGNTDLSPNASLVPGSSPTASTMPPWFDPTLQPHSDPDHAANGFYQDPVGGTVNGPQAAFHVASGTDPSTLPPGELANLYSSMAGHFPGSALTDTGIAAKNALHQLEFPISKEIASHTAAVQPLLDQAQTASDLAGAQMVRAGFHAPGADLSDPDYQASLDARVLQQFEPQVRSIVVNGADGQPDDDATLAARQAYARTHLGITSADVLDHLGDDNYNQGHDSINDLAESDDADDSKAAQTLKANWKQFSKLSDDDKQKWLADHGIDADSTVGKAALDADDLDDTGTGAYDAGSSYVNPSDNRHKLNTGDAIGLIGTALLASKAPPGVMGQALQGYLAKKEDDASTDDDNDKEQYQREVNGMQQTATAYARHAQDLAQQAQSHQTQAEQLRQQLAQGYGAYQQDQANQADANYKQQDLALRQRYGDEQAKKMEADIAKGASDAKTNYLKALNEAQNAKTKADQNHYDSITKRYEAMSKQPPDSEEAIAQGVGVKRNMAKELMPGLSPRQYDALARMQPGQFIRDTATANQANAKAVLTGAITGPTVEAIKAKTNNLNSMIQNRAQMQRLVQARIDALNAQVTNGTANAATKQAATQVNKLRDAMAAAQKLVTDVELTNKAQDGSIDPKKFAADQRVVSGAYDRANKLVNDSMQKILEVPVTPPEDKPGVPPPKGKKPLEIDKGVIWKQ